MMALPFMLAPMLTTVGSVSRVTAAILVVVYIPLIGGLAYLGRCYASDGQPSAFVPKAIAAIFLYLLATRGMFSGLLCLLATVIVLLQTRRAATKGERVAIYLTLAIIGCYAIVMSDAKSFFPR
jgi:hypothetical protein